MKIYRIEHTESKLGPYEHNNREQIVVNKGLYGNTNFDGKIIMVDIDRLEPVLNILKKYSGLVKFGFNSLDKLNLIIKDVEFLRSHGFEKYMYIAEPLYVSDDGQVLFIPDFTKRNII